MVGHGPRDAKEAEEGWHFEEVGCQLSLQPPNCCCESALRPPNDAARALHAHACKSANSETTLLPNMNCYCDSALCPTMRLGHSAWPLGRRRGRFETVEQFLCRGAFVRPVKKNGGQRFFHQGSRAPQRAASGRCPLPPMDGKGLAAEKG